MTDRIPVPRRLGLAANGLAAVAFLVAVVTFLIAVHADDPNRIRAFGCTIILHGGGEAVVRLSSGRLVRTEAFTHIDPYLIWTLCSAYLALWTTGLILIAVDKRRRAVTQAPRGFPLD